MPARAFPDVSRWLSRGLLVLPLLTGMALVGGAFSNRQRTHEASELLVRAQVASLVRSLVRTLRTAEAAPSEVSLTEALDELSSDGLRYLALLTSNGSVLAEAGQASTPAAKPATTGPMQLIRQNDRVRVTVKLPSGRSRRLWRQRSRRHLDAHSLPPWLSLEVAPSIADRLRKDADRAFGLSALTALALTLITAMLWRQLRRRELLAESVERERRLAQLGEMSAILAHEIRNPLASLKGNAQLLVEQLSSSSREGKKAARIVSEATRLEELSHTLLDFVRSGSVEKRLVDPEALVRQAAREIGASRVRITTKGTGARKVLLDPLRSNQVLVNLLDNALQASPDDQVVEVSLELTARALRLEVRDHGPGLTPGEEVKVFEAFHTKRTHGTGLGLAIARRIVELHGGTLTAHNHPDGGAVFVMEIAG